MKLQSLLHPCFAPARPVAAPGASGCILVPQPPQHPRAGHGASQTPGPYRECECRHWRQHRGSSSPTSTLGPLSPSALGAFPLPQLGATSGAAAARPLARPARGCSSSLQQMALFSSVSSPLLLEVSLGDSVLKGPQHFPSPILHEASWKLVKAASSGGSWRWQAGPARPQ